MKTRRGFFGFFALVALLLAALAVTALVIVPMIVRPMVVDAVRAASPFGDQPIDVQVDLNPVGLLLGTIDRIHVTGTDLEAEGATIGSLDLAISDVATSSHAFRSLAGRLTSVTLPFVHSRGLTLDTVDLAGSTGAVTATARLDVRSSLALVGNAFADAGIAVDGLELTASGVAFGVLGQRLEVPLGVDDGALVIPDVAGAGPLVIVEPGPDDPWRITGVRGTGAGFEIDVALEAGVVPG